MGGGHDQIGPEFAGATADLFAGMAALKGGLDFQTFPIALFDKFAQLRRAGFLGRGEERRQVEQNEIGVGAVIMESDGVKEDEPGLKLCRERPGVGEAVRRGRREIGRQENAAQTQGHGLGCARAGAFSRAIR